MEIIPLYGLLGFIPFVKSWGVGGLQKAWEIYPLAFIHGFVMGGLSSYCRSFFGLLIPPGSEAAFYALYAITDKGSSAVGPAIVGMIVDATGQIRPAFLFLAVLIALPAPLIWMVDAEKGQADAVRMAGIMKKGAGEEELDERDEGLQEAEGLMRDHD
jgi:MFS transporter, UMF1 family